MTMLVDRTDISGDAGAALGNLWGRRCEGDSLR